MSSWSAVPRTAFAVSASSAPCAGTSRQIDVGAVAREHLGDRGADAARGAGHERDLAGQRALPVLRRGRDRLADLDRPGRPRTRSGRRAGSAASTRGCPRRRARRARAGPSRRARSSLAAERTKPSSARWATAARASPAAAGGVPSTSSRPLGADLADVRVEECRRAPRSSSARLMPDASNTIAPSGSVSSARSRARRPPAFAAARRVLVGHPGLGADRREHARGRLGEAAAGRGRRAARAPRSTGCPGSWRRSRTGSGRPRRRTTRRPGRESANCW